MQGRERVSDAFQSVNCRRNSSGYFFMTDCFTVCAECFKTIVTNCSTSVEVCLLRLEVVIILCLNYNFYLILMKPSYEDNSIQFVSKPFRILDKKKTELAKIGKFMPSCTIKVCVLALRNRNPGNEWSFLSGRTSRGFHKHASKHTNYELKIGRVGPPWKILKYACYFATVLYGLCNRCILNLIIASSCVQPHDQHLNFLGN